MIFGSWLTVSLFTAEALIILSYIKGQGIWSILHDGLSFLWYSFQWYFIPSYLSHPCTWWYNRPCCHWQLHSHTTIISNPSSPLILKLSSPKFPQISLRSFKENIADLYYSSPSSYHDITLAQPSFQQFSNVICLHTPCLSLLLFIPLTNTQDKNHM